MTPERQKQYDRWMSGELDHTFIYPAPPRQYKGETMPDPADWMESRATANDTADEDICANCEHDKSFHLGLDGYTAVPCDFEEGEDLCGCKIYEAQP